MTTGGRSLSPNDEADECSGVVLEASVGKSGTVPCRDVLMGASPETSAEASEFLRCCWTRGLLQDSPVRAHMVRKPLTTASRHQTLGARYGRLRLEERSAHPSRELGVLPAHSQLDLLYSRRKA